MIKIIKIEKYTTDPDLLQIKSCLACACTASRTCPVGSVWPAVLEHHGVLRMEVVLGVVGGFFLHDLPPEVELLPLVLQLPHVAGQGGADPLVAGLHVGLFCSVNAL